MPSINLNNLERYDSKAKNEAEEEYMPKDSGNWQKTEEAGAVAFYPVGGSSLEGTVKFLFRETPPASGEKGPENPSTITGVDSITVTRCGKNLFERIGDGTVTSNGLTLVRNADGTCTLSGTAATNTFFYINSSNLIQTKAGLTYTLSGCPSGGSASTYRLACTTTKDGTAYYYVEYGSGTSASKPFDGRWQMYIYVVSGTVISTPIVFKPQFELGSTATSFEPYDGTDYTIPLGSTYYGGEIDLATGLMTVTQIGYELDSSSGWNTTSADYTYRTFKSKAVTITGQNYNAITPLFKCSHFTLSTSDTTLMPDNAFYPRGDGNIVISTANLSLQDFKDWLDAQKLAGTPFVVTYPLAEPQTVQLSPLALAALAQTSRHEPRLNTVYTDAEAVQIGYMKSPQRTEQEITQALLEIESNGSD